ncbi:MAG: STAS domain-containing protein [Jatrophihabitans sp.]|uniref:STAS domain-containing protein n=1 Tax=Jatrophihabitans sp. TaxID=1932789 RepID=UPI003F7EA3DB
MDLTLDTTSYDGAAVLRVAGDIDMQTAGALRDRLTECLETGAGRVVVDLSAVDFLDSSALGALVAAARSAGEGGSALRVAAPKPHVRKIFQITRLLDVLGVHDTVEDALAD